MKCGKLGIPTALSSDGSQISRSGFLVHRDLPAAPWRFRSYIPSAGSNREPLGQDVKCGVHISVEMRSTARTCPFTFAELKDVSGGTTLTASLRGRKPTADFYDRSPVPLGLVDHHASEFTPSSISYRTRCSLGAQHPLHRQSLKTDRLVFTDQPGRELVQKIAPSIHHPRMDAGHSDGCLLPVVRSFLLSSCCTLRFCELSLLTLDVPRVLYLLSGRDSGKVKKPEINTNGRRRIRSTDLMNLHAARQKPPAVGFPDNSDSGGRTRHWPAPNYPQWAVHLCQLQASRRPTECRIDELGGLASALRFEPRMPIEATEKTTISGIQVPKRLLQRHRRNVSQPRHFGLRLPLSQHPAGIEQADELASISPRRRSRTQSMVVDRSDAAKCPRQQILLLAGGIETETIGRLHFAFHEEQVSPDKRNAK